MAGVPVAATTGVEVQATEERVPQKENIKYEDEHVRLTDLELVIKGTSEADPQTIPLSEIQHVSWGGDNLYEKTKHWWTMNMFGLKSLLGNSSDNNNTENTNPAQDDNSSSKKKKSKKQLSKEKRHNQRFVVVASKYQGTAPVSFGFSVTEDPLAFHKLMVPERYAEAPEGERESTLGMIRRTLSKENLMAIVSSAGSLAGSTGKIIKRTLSKDNLLSIAGSQPPAAASAEDPPRAHDVDDRPFPVRMNDATDDRPLPPR